jgi:hypothetical protein
MWDDAGQNIIEHLAGVEDFEVAEAAYRAAVKKWPKAVITLRAGARVIHDSRQRPSSAARTSPASSAAKSWWPATWSGCTKKLLEFEHIDHISDEMRAVSEDLWPELVCKLPPKEP